MNYLHDLDAPLHTFEVAKPGVMPEGRRVLQEQAAVPAACPAARGEAEAQQLARVVAAQGVLPQEPVVLVEAEAKPRVEGVLAVPPHSS